MGAIEGQPRRHSSSQASFTERLQSFSRSLTNLNKYFDGDTDKDT